MVYLHSCKQQLAFQLSLTTSILTAHLKESTYNQNFFLLQPVPNCGLLFMHRRSGNFRGKNNSRLKFSRVLIFATWRFCNEARIRVFNFRRPSNWRKKNLLTYFSRPFLCKLLHHIKCVCSMFLSILRPHQVQLHVWENMVVWTHSMFVMQRPFFLVHSKSCNTRQPRSNYYKT